jgi:hypothetical protein
MMLKSRKFSDFDLARKLNDLGWKGKYFAFSNEVTYLSEDNKTIAVVTYDNRKSVIVTADFKI